MKLLIDLAQDDYDLIKENYDQNKDRLKNIGVNTIEDFAAMLCNEAIMNLPAIIESKQRRLTSEQPI